MFERRDTPAPHPRRPLPARQASSLSVALAALLALATWALRPAGVQATAPNVLSELTANVSDRSFTVSWVTDQPASATGAGKVFYGTNQTALGFSINEQAIVAGARGDVHTATVTGLQPSTTYYFYISIAGSSFYQSAGVPYSVKTAATATNTSPNRTATGKILQSNDTSPAPGVLVSAQIYDLAGLNGGQVAYSATMSTITDSQGKWTLTLNPRTQDGAAFFQYQTGATPTNGTPDQLQVTVNGGALGNSSTSPLVLNFGGGTTFSASSPLVLTPATPTATPGSQTATPTTASTPTAVFTSVSRATVPATATLLSTATPSATGTATPTPSPLPPSPTPAPPPPTESFPTPEPILPTEPPAAPVVLPTVAPAAPPVPTQAPSLPIQPTPTVVPPPPTSPAPGATPTVPAASIGMPSSAQPSPLALAFPYNPDPTPPPSVPTPVAPSPTPTLVVEAPAVDPFAPLTQIATLLLAAVGAAGLGLALLVVGLVRQAKER